MKGKMALLGIEEEFKKLFQTREKLTQEQARLDVSKMVNDLKQATPIDTGLAQQSWKTIELPNTFVVENTTEYIQYLNEGSSKQAPARFIESIALKYGVPLGTIVEVKE